MHNSHVFNAFLHRDTTIRPDRRMQLGAVLISVNHNLPLTYSRRMPPLTARLSFVQLCTGIRLASQRHCTQLIDYLPCATQSPRFITPKL